MIGAIARREVREIFRDGRFIGSAVCVAALLLLAIATGWTYYREVSAQHERAQAETRRHWLAQPPKDPHSAAHYSIYAFKPRVPLALFDTGVDRYAGVAALLEAHKQNEFQFRPAQDQSTVLRFGDLTAATLLQFVLPLLILLLAVDTFAGERERGTLRLLLSAGAPPRAVAVGKLLGIGAALSLVVVPAAIAGAAALVFSSGAASMESAFARGAALAAVYAVYLTGIACTALAVSGRARTARGALALLIAAWSLNVVVAPRVATDVARWLYPTPGAFQFAEHVERQTYDGLDVHAFNVRRARDLERRLLEQYAVGQIRDVPVNFRGVDYLEREAHASRVFDAAYGELWAAFDQQAQLQQTAGFLAPLLAVRSLSMAVAGTDYVHHRRFAQAAETYRRQLVETMNTALAHGGTSANPSVTAGPELWASLPPFAYRGPPLASALSTQARSLLALALFLVVGVAALARVASTLNVE
jgi:ABC-2 type transport system permease protein